MGCGEPLSLTPKPALYAQGAGHTRPHTAETGRVTKAPQAAQVAPPSQAAFLLRARTLPLPRSPSP